MELNLIETICEKDGNIQIDKICKDGYVRVVVPVFNAEQGIKQEAVIKIEWSFDGDWIILYNFPENLLNDEDYDYICETIMDEYDLWELR